MNGSDLSTIEGYVAAAVAARNAAGDANVEFFNQIAPKTSASYACQYHPNAAEQAVMGNQLATEIGSKLGWATLQDGG